MTATITYRDNQPDNEGRRHFLCEWESAETGYFRNEPGLFGQVFFTKPETVIEDFKKRGFEIAINENPTFPKFKTLEKLK